MREETLGAPPHVDGYDGPARLTADGVLLDVDVRLRGLFQPIDGRYHWYGRLTQDEGVDDLVSSGAAVSLVTPEGTAVARLADRDPWGRYRISGTGRPPWTPQRTL